MTTPLTGRNGLTLIEVVVALSILATVLIALGGLMFEVGRRTRASAVAAYRAAAAGKAATWIHGLPWDSLDGTIGCQTDTAGQLVYDRCVTVQDVALNLKRITVAISPSGALVLRPETVVVDRGRRLVNPFNVNE